MNHAVQNQKTTLAHRHFESLLISPDINQNPTPEDEGLRSLATHLDKPDQVSIRPARSIPFYTQ